MTNELTVNVDNDANVMVETVEQGAALVTAMGYDGLTGWYRDTGVNMADLLKKWWTVQKDRVYIEDGPVGPVSRVSIADQFPTW